MSEHCPEFERIIELLSDGRPQPPAWQDHRAECSSCRSQWAVHQALKQVLSNQPAPTLSTQFERVLDARVRKEQSGMPPLLKAYIVIATLLLAAAFFYFSGPFWIRFQPVAMAVLLIAAPLSFLLILLPARRWLQALQS